MHYLSSEVPREIGSKLWSSVIAPRPVFLVVSENQQRVSNIAAYSSISLISIYPPIAAIAFGKRSGQFKNTLLNILATKQFSVNAVGKDLAEKANLSAAGSDISEDFDRLSLTKRSFDFCKCAGVAESPVSIACEYLTTVDVPESSITLILAKCVELIVDDKLVSDGVFDPVAANLIGSVGLEEYITLKGVAFTQPRTWE